jgi:hypothetical protein
MVSGRNVFAEECNICLSLRPRLVAASHRDVTAVLYVTAKISRGMSGFPQKADIVECNPH